MFEKANVPLLENYLHENIFPIQVQMLFGIFSEKIKKIKDIETDLTQNDKIIKEKKIELDNLFKENELFEDQNDLNEEEDFDFINEDGFINEIQDAKMEEKDEDSNLLNIGDDEKLEDEALLKTINYLTNKQFADEYPIFTKFKQTLLNDFIPCFVMKFFNISSIEKVQLSKEKSSNILTKRNIENIYLVIKFLSKKQKAFEVLMFDFYTPFERESSAKLFFKNFLNFFFITQPRDEMIERLKIFIGNSGEEHRVLNMNMPRYKLLIQTMRFISKKPDDMLDGLLQIYHKFFELFSVPIVFHNSQWNTFDNDNVLPDSYFYQIKFLFNEWDSNTTTFQLIELLLKSKYKFQNMKVPRFDIIASSIKAKTMEPELSNEDEIQALNDEIEEKDEEASNVKENLEIKKNEILRFYKERQKLLGNNNDDDLLSKLKKTQKLNEKSRIELSENAILFWDPTFEFDFYDNGIIRKSVSEEDKIINFQSIGINNNNSIRSFYDQIYSAQPNGEIPDEINTREFAIKMLNSHSNKETELCKIFIYDEEEKEWIFDSQAFQDFAKTKRLNTSGTMTPLVFIANSDEQNIIDFNSHFIHGLYPKFEKEEQIFVYALCDKSLTMLSMKNDFSDQIKASTKPIFLQIHVPKSKEKYPHIQTILSRMICYLTCISSLSIIIMRDQISQDQISYFQKILSISKLANKNNESDSNEDQNENENENEKRGIIYKKSRTIYLINIPKIAYDEGKAVEYHNHSAFYNYIDKSDENEILLIDVNNIETYNHFFDSLSINVLRNQMSFVDVEQDFNSFYGFEMCSRYIEMRSSSDWKSKIKDIIIARYLMFISKSESKSSEKLSNALTDVYNEIVSFSPRFDFEFVKEYQSIILSMRKNTSQMNRKEIAIELAISADYDISLIIGLLENEDFYTNEQLNSMRKNHEIFLKNEYYDIVKLTSIESMFDLVFEDNFDLVSLQIDNDREKLNNKFKYLIDTLQKMKTVNESSAQENAKKNTNYMLKETENLREIKVAVQIKKDLTSIIEQDF